MRKIYTFLFITSLVGLMSAQTTVDFTIAEGYSQGPLEASSNWGGANWIVNPTAGIERAETTAGYSWARWGDPFTVSDTEITFEVHFKFNIDLPAGKLIARFGFNDNGSNSGNIANIQLSTLNDGSLSVRKQGNTPVDSGGAGLTNFQQDDLVLKITLTLGSDASNSSLSSSIINVTDNISSNVAFINGISNAIFTTATSVGISGFIHAQDNINGTRGFLVDKVVMSQGNTLNVNSYSLPAFNLSKNPIEDIVQLRGVSKGSEISIYNVAGSEVNKSVYDGNQLNLVHLSDGVYFIKVPGFKTQKLIKK